MNIINFAAPLMLTVGISSYNPALWAMSQQAPLHQGHTMSMSMSTSMPMQDHPMGDDTMQAEQNLPLPVAAQAKQVLASDHSDHSDHSDPHAAHAKEHGGQIYQFSQFETKWLDAADGAGEFQTEFQTRIGTDENKLYLRVHADKAESESTETAVQLMYSRNVAPYWDVQVGARYLGNAAWHTDRAQFDAVLGVQGLAPYFFETEAYFYVGADDRYSLSLETERDYLLTQKWIVKPYLNANIVISDHSAYAQKTGLNLFELGFETRYEINKKLMPFIDVVYRYDKGDQQTAWQPNHPASDDWHYGAGLRLRF